jgi:hypothetical protein
MMTEIENKSIKNNNNYIKPLWMNSNLIHKNPIIINLLNGCKTLQSEIHPKPITKTSLKFGNIISVIFGNDIKGVKNNDFLMDVKLSDLVNTEDVKNFG